MSRGIVMETGSKHVIVLMPDGQFRKVRTALKPQIGEEFIFAEQRRLQRPRKLYSFSAGAAAVMILLFAPFIVQHFSSQPNVVAYLTMDVNPSIELGIDKHEHVEVLRAINADGAAVTKDLAFKGLPLQQVTEAIMDRISAGPYLNSGEGDVVIASVAVDSGMLAANEIDLTSHMDTAVRKSLAKTDKGRELKVEVTTLSAPAEVRDEAERAGVSSGKMAFYLMAKEQGYRISIKQLKSESIHQAAKPMGGVAAVLNDDAGGKNDADSRKGKTDIGVNGGKVADTTPLKQQMNEPQNPAPAKVVSTEAQREQQKQQLQELLKHEQEKRKEREENGGHRPGDHGPDNRGSRHGDDKPNDAKSDGAKNAGPKNDDSKNGANPANVPLQNGGMINVSDGQHSPGNNGGHGNGGGSKKDDRGNPVKAPAPPPPKQPQQSPNNSDSHDNGGNGHSRANGNSNGKGKGGSDEAKNASDGRHEGVQSGNGNDNGGGKPAKEEDSRGSNRDKDDDRAKDGDRGKDADDGRSHGSGDNGRDDGDKGHSGGGKGR